MIKLNSNIDRLGTAGLFITALLSPCCFPLFAFAATALGLGTVELFGGWTMWLFQLMVIISLVGFVIAYLKHRCTYPLLIAVPGAVCIFYGYHFSDAANWIYFLYAGMLAQLLATVVNFYKSKAADCCTETVESVKLQSIITCPFCKHEKLETMPQDACVYFYYCQNCNKRLQPQKGDCCVFCSYGSVKCPPIQAGNKCC